MITTAAFRKEFLNKLESLLAKEERETAFQELLADLNDDTAPTEAQKRHYATAGERV